MSNLERYSKVQSNLWTNSKKFKDLSIDERYVYLYLLTCQHGNSAGIYRMIPAYSAFDCKMKLEDYESAIRALSIALLIAFDDTLNIVYVKQYMRFNPITNKKHAQGTAKVAAEYCESSVYPMWKSEVSQYFKGFEEFIVDSKYVEKDSCMYSPIDSPIDTTPIHVSIQQNTDNRIQITDNNTLSDIEISDDEDKNKLKVVQSDDDLPKIEDTVGYGIAEYLWLKILANNPKAKKPNLEKWAIAADRMFRIDKRPKKDIQDVIDWCQQDEFWSTNILSTEKLRKQFDQLYAKMKQSTKKSNGNSTNYESYDDLPEAARKYLEG